MKEKIWKIVILSLVAIAFFGLPFSMLAFGSDIQTRQSGLYPYQSIVEIQDDFMAGIASSGSVGSLGWNATGSVISAAGTAANPGQYTLQTTATSGTVARINFHSSSIFGAANPFSVVWIIQLNTNDANTTVRLGAQNSVGANPPNDGVYFEKLDADTNWFCVTRAGGVETRTDSGIAITTNFTTFAYTRNSTGVTWRIGSSAVCGTHTTNITSAIISPIAFIINSAAANKTLNVDYFQMVMNGLARL